MRWWAWLLIVIGIVLVALLIWWLLRRSRRPQPRRPMAVPMAALRSARVPHAAPIAGPPAGASEGAATPDDLTVIEGIGPKIAATLREAGIKTFAQLAATEAEQLSGILRRAGLRLADPTTWPEQAALAAAGKRNELEALQGRLKGGRRLA